MNQVELHPFLFDPALLDYCQGKGIQLESWSPLTRAQRFDGPTVAAVAKACGCENVIECRAEETAKVVDYLAAESLLDTKCSVCHETSRPLSKNKSYDDWKATVTRMSGKKAGHLSAAEIEEIASFLAVERPAQ